MLNFDSAPAVIAVRERLINILLGVASLLVVLQIPLLLYRAEIFEDAALTFRLINCSIILLMFLARNYIPTIIKSGYLILAGLSAGTAGLFVFGVAGAGLPTLIATTFGAAIAISLRTAIGVLIYTTVLLCYLTYKSYIGEGINPQVIESYSSSWQAWMNDLFIYVMITVAVVYALRIYFNLLLESIASLEDNLEQKSAKAEESQSLLQAVIDAVPYRIFWKDRQSVFLGANKAFLKDANKQSEKEIIGKDDFEMPWYKEAEGFRADDAEIVASGNSKLFMEEVQTLHDGSKHYVMTSKVPLKRSSGKVYGVLGAYDDITDRKLQELELEQARLEAEQANHAKTEFLANMSHELRTPLNGVNGLIDLCLGDQLNEKQRDYLLKAKSSATNLQRIIDDILDISKIEAGKIDLEKINLSIADIANQVKYVIDPLVNEKNIKFAFNIEGVEEQHYKGDPTRIFQILTNLCSNAVKFTKQGSVTLTLKIEPVGDRLQLSFSVDDTGIGIAPDHMEEVFGKFTQANSTISRNFGGTGLGLAIVKHLVEMMDGKISVQSVVDKGSRFFGHIMLDFLTEKETVTVNSPKVVENDLSNLTILLVEDNMVNQLVAQDMLENAGANVVIAEDGQQALDKLVEQSFDAVLMDIQMPVMDGKEATKIIRANDKYNNLPVIALTANVLSHDVEEYMSLGFNAHLGKPFEREQLVELIHKHLSSQ